MAREIGHHAARREGVVRDGRGEAIDNGVDLGRVVLDSHEEMSCVIGEETIRRKSGMTEASSCQCVL